MFAVRIANPAIKALKKADKEIRERVGCLAETLAAEPIPYGSYDLLKLSGLDNYYRVRLSSYRVIYEIRWEQKAIMILEIKRRSETAYKKL